MDVLIIAVALGIMPTDFAVEDQVDLVELNHFYQGQDGSHVFDQVIWYRLNVAECRYDIVDWRLLRGVRMPVTDKQKEDHRLGVDPDPCPPVGRYIDVHATPTPRHDGRYSSDWFDEKAGGIRRRVTATVFPETWTITDPELEQRDTLPQSQRRGLSASR